MKTELFLLCLIAFVLPFRSYGTGLASEKDPKDNRKPLVLKIKEHPFVNEVGQETRVALINGPKMGVFLTNSDGKTYDGKNYNNIKCTLNTTNKSSHGEAYLRTPVLLSESVGAVYAYYPHQASGVSLEAIPISNDGTDWMYTPKPSNNVNNTDTVALLEMKHVMSVLNVIVRGGEGYTNTPVKEIQLVGDSWASSATLNLKTGEIGSYVDEGEPIIAKNVGNLNSGVVSVSFGILSNEKPSSVMIKLTTGEGYLEGTKTIPIGDNIVFERGKVYTCEIIMALSAWDDTTDN